MDFLVILMGSSADRIPCACGFSATQLEIVRDRVRADIFNEMNKLRIKKTTEHFLK